MDTNEDTCQIAAGSIRADVGAWPRHGLDEDRVAEFMGLYAEQGAEALPPIEVVPTGSGEFTVADGWHRLTAQTRLGVELVPAVVTPPRPGQSAAETAYERALETAARTAKPLTRAEKRAAITRLIGERPDSSDREIARLVGVDHKTVGSLRRRLGSSPTSDEDDEVPAGERYLVALGADEIALGLARETSRLWDARGLSDALFGDRLIGHRLAHALTIEHGEDARRWAGRIQQWATFAVSDLDREAGS